MPQSIVVSAISETWQLSTNSFYERLAKLFRLSSSGGSIGKDGKVPLHIVVAPEYYFRRSPLMVINDLKQTYHGSRGIDKKDTSKRLTQEMLDGYIGPKWVSTLYSKTDCEYLQSAMGAASASGNTLIIPGTIFWAEKEPLMQTGKKRSQRNKQLAKGIARNTSFAFHNGNKLSTYNKNTDSHELDDTDQESFVFLGGDTSSVFTIGDLKIGVEICMDHTHSILKTAANDLDVHILVSDGMAPDRKFTATRKGGIVISCDSSGSAIMRDGSVIKKGMQISGEEVEME